MRITSLEPGEVFVFGSNAAGMHAAGAAALAHEKFGAVWGQGHGLHGRTYAINSMSGLAVLRQEVLGFVEFAAEHPELRFLVTEIGCGIAGYTPTEVAPFFDGVGDNVVLPDRFAAELGR
jgi:hypothetical protein